MRIVFNKKICVVVIVVLVASTIFYVSYRPPSEPDDWATVVIDPSTVANNTSVNKNSYKYLNLTTSFIKPTKVTNKLPVLRISEANYDNKSSLQALRTYGLLFINNDTVWMNGSSAQTLINDGNRTTIKYNGFIEYEDENISYVPRTETTIASYKSLYNKSEAADRAISYLVEHHIYNSSWYQAFNLTKYRTNVTTGNSTVIHYLFKWVPTYNEMPIIDSDTPSVTVKINPIGEIVQLKMMVCNITFAKSSVALKWNDPELALYELDINITQYMLVDVRNPNVQISNMFLGYHVNPSNTTELIPTWIFSTVGNKGYITL